MTGLMNKMSEHYITLEDIREMRGETTKKLIDLQHNRIVELERSVAYRNYRLGFAEQLIDELGSEEMKKQWIDFMKRTDEEYKQNFSN